MKKKFEELKQYEHILLTANNYKLLALMQAMGKDGIRPTVVAYGDRFAFGATYSRFYKNFIRVDNAKKGVEYILKTYKNEKHKNFLYPCDEGCIGVVNDCYDDLKDYFYFFNAGEQGKLSRYLDKLTLCNLAKECGFRIPVSEMLIKGNLPQNISFPIFVKSIKSLSNGWKHDYTICNNQQELLDAYPNMYGEEFLVQEYIKKTNEQALVGISINRGKQVYVPFRKWFARMLETDFGTYMYWEKRVNDELMPELQLMMQKIGYSGVFEAEFLEDDSKKKIFLEINFRFTCEIKGTLWGGANLPLLWAFSELNGYIDESAIQLYEKRFYGINEMRDLTKNVLTHKLSFWTWLKDICKSEVRFIYDKSDPIPTIVYWTNFIAHFIPHKAYRLLIKIKNKFHL